MPEFYETDLFETTLFPTNVNDEGNWPPRAADERNPKRQMPVEAQALAYNRLQQFMNKNMRFDGAQFFYRMEMRCKGKIDGGAYGAMHAVFDAVSEYGNSVWKPVSWLLVLIAAGAAAMLFHLEMGEPATGEKFWTSFGWSISNMLPFLGAGKLYYGAEFVACLPVWLKALGGFQTLLGFILLFFLGLGLRNRFRLR